MAKKELNLTILPDNLVLKFTLGENLKQILNRGGIFITYPCGGKGICGKCLIQIIEGVCPEPTLSEQRFISPARLSRGYRLACQIVPDGNLVIKIPPMSWEKAGKLLLETPIMRKLSFAPAVRRVFLDTLKPATIKNQQSDADLISKQLKINSWSLSALQKLPLTLRNHQYKATVTLYNDCILDIEGGNTVSQIYGVAVDIGTTTVAVALVNLHNDIVLGRKAQLNPQRLYGADVILRLGAIFSARKEAGNSKAAMEMVKQLQRLIVSAINELIKTLCVENNLALTGIYEVVCAGNTVMNHLLLGIDPEYLGLAPFVSVFKSSQVVRAGELGLQIHPEGVVYVLPNIGGFVGGDIVADMLVAGIDIKQHPVMLIDIGTNGEVVVRGRDGRLWATSAAAGPAFEGAKISQGMLAAPGAIDRLVISPERGWRISTIAGERPVGVCGSGLVSAIAELRRAGLIERSGRISARSSASATARTISQPELAERLADRLTEINGERAILLAGKKERAAQPVYLTQSDVRELQYAKSALATAQEILLRLAGIKPREIETLYIAGAFGNYIAPEDALQIGLVHPDIPLSKIKFIGNAALAGAILILRNKRARCLAERIAAETQFIELATQPDFQETFAHHLAFP